MTTEQWLELAQLNPYGVHNFGSPEKMSFGFLKIVDAWATKLDLPVYVRYGTNGTHSPGSLHVPKNNADGEGHAVDLIVDLKKTNAIDTLLTTFRFPFTGIGVYPDWNGLTPIGHVERSLGLHLEHDPNASERKMWAGYYRLMPDGVRAQMYASLDSTVISRILHV